MENRTKTTTEQTWDTIAESFDTTRKKPWKQSIDFIGSLPKTSFIADLGCGNGRHLLVCAEQGHQVVGVDISRNLLKITQKKINQKGFTHAICLQGDLVNVPLKDNVLDAVLYIASLHNIQGRKNRICSLKEVKRILKPEGKALISVWSRWQDTYRMRFFKKMFTRRADEEFGDIMIYWRQHQLNTPRFYHLYGKHEFIQDVRRSGLRIDQVQSVKFHSRVSPDNYFIVATKES